ncbi:IgGFc-binding protein isoform X2 [Dunckerocampus dactyliophorus]|uniref:IgGFc-binding protein isoform X2 n=1 Tax=Dunckerocampus dactyliophorus TaxID=161453 RepID=UPI002406A69E|nr:IgGFc-binding protein isoform X2 [Dunckerocampus dactyliophorus]
MMQFVLLLQVSLVGLGFSVASPGRDFLMRFPPHNDPKANARHQVTITATSIWTSVTVKVLQSDFTRHISLAASQSETVNLPLSVGTASAHSSLLLSVTSVQPVTVLASFCTQTGCEHSLLHDVSSWGANYYPVTPNFPSQMAVSEMVVTSSDQETSVDIFLSGEVVFNGDSYRNGSVLNLHLGAFESLYLQSNFSLCGSELYSQEPVGVIVGFTCFDHTVGECLYGFAELKPVSSWSFEYFVPRVVNAGISPSLLLAMTKINADLDVITRSGKKNLSLRGGVMKTIPVVASDNVYILSDVPLQLIYFRHDIEQRASTLTALLSVEDICHSGPMFDAEDISSHPDDTSNIKHIKAVVELSHEHAFTPTMANNESSSTYVDVGHYLNTMNKELYPSVCEKNKSCDLHCGRKQKCFIKNGNPSCSSKTKICSAWGDSYYRTFDGTFFVLLGNCNYTLVQTTCAGLNTSSPLQVNIARAYLNGAIVSSIHSVEIKIKGFNISMFKGERNQIRVNGHRRYLPLTFGDGYLKIYPSGLGVVLDTSFGMTLQYDWLHNFQVEVSPELHGVLCGLCGSASDSLADGIIASNGPTDPRAVDLTLPWVLDSNAGSCMEDCGRGPCPVCSQSTIRSYPGIKDGSPENKCTLLKRTDGPFSDCHLYIDPQPFVLSCVNNQCLGEGTASMCKVLMAYAKICQRAGGRIQNWRSIAKCHLACPENSHYEACGSACQPTCANPEAQRICSLPCVESCQCNRGYLLSDGKCVSPSKCGCVHNGSYHLPMKTFWLDKQCHEKCVCQPHSKTVMCTQSHCQTGKVCKVINGLSGCHADGPGLCIAKGDSHYTTFDGRKFDVHGNCSYLLTSHCPTWGDLQDFRVEVQNHISQTANFSFRRVKLSVAGYSIEVSNEWSNKIMVNGLLLNLPSVLSRGKVMLYLKGQSKRIETDFGVVVTYSSDTLTVTMPRVFSGNLCGLCGNFNENSEDDLVPDDTFDIVQAVRQWRTSHEHECLDAPINTSGCSQQEQALYQGKDFCGRLLDPEGAFQSCHNMVDPQDFYDNCVYDLCNGNQMALCQILSSYVAVCQEVGTLVDKWRGSNFCSITCPPNSEYHLCSSHKSACVQIPSPLSEGCKEGCFCKPGFFHSGGECVANSECGCSHNGVYHKIHENFHPDENCLQSCLCVGRNEVQCTNHTCTAGTKCAIKHGLRACHASQLKCTVMGERHVQTFHGHLFDVNIGSWSYLLFQLCDDPGLSAVIQQGQLDLRVYGMILILTRKHLEKVKINGVLMTLPVHINGVAVLLSGSLTRVVCPDIGVVVIYGGPNLIQITILATHKRLCGLCGNAATDDQGSLMSDQSKTPSSWCLSPATHCTVECHNCSQCNSTKEFASDSLCGMLLAPEGSFGGCHSTVDPMPFFQNCVNDLCRSNNDELLCDSLRLYTFACQDAGAEIKPWRGDKCALSCPKHSYYNICVGACSESCAVLSDVPCPWPCYEGCQCDSGYKQSGSNCVRPEQCGCFFGGQYHKVGELLWNEGCSKRCNCCYTATLCCEPASCPKGQSCVLNETWHCAEKNLSCPMNSHYESCGTACPATCKANFNSSCTLACVEGCQCDPGFVLDGDTCVHPSQCGCTYNGHSYHHNETFWGDDSCTRQCVCDPYTHQVDCHVAYCDPEEYCDVQDGVGRCVKHDFQMCIYTGHRILTFDQRGYNFFGTCQYQLLGICEQRQGLDVFQVNVQSDGHLQSTQNVLVAINGQLLTIDSKNPDNIKVNGTKRNLPFYPTNTALVFSLGLHTYIFSASGFALSISKEGTVVIELSINGTQEHLTPEQFGKAWRSGQNHWCVEGCLGGSCPNCSSEALGRFSDAKACGKILEVNGPFRDCHSKVDPSSFYKNCVSDLCLYGDVQPAVCHSLADYADVCLYHKALVYAWRSPEFCYESCPSSTIYSMSTAPIHICIGWYNYTLELFSNIGENCLCEAGLVHSGSGCVHPNNCGCLHYGEYFTPGEVVSTCDQRCLCHPGGNLTCVDVSCSEEEECKLVEGVQGCHPKAKMAYCSINGSQYTTFDGRGFEFHGSCNYTLVKTCSLKGLDVEPLFITVRGNGAGKRLHLQVSNITFKISTAYPGKIQVNGLDDNFTFSQNNVTVLQKNKWTTIKIAHSVEIISGLPNHIEVKLLNNYHQTTCGLCGNYNDDPSDDMQLPNGTAVSNPNVFGTGWKLSDSESSCRDTCDSTCQQCLSPVPEYSSDLYCGVVNQSSGPFSLCHPLISPQKYYSLCMNNLCVAQGQKRALCDALEVYEAACKVAGVSVDPWRNSTGCASKCPQFSHFRRCANVCSSLCPGISHAVQCPTQCEEGCECEAQHLFDGHACVPAEQCGCMHDGRRIKVSESKLLQNCTVNCTCGPPLVCEEHKCPPLYSCIVLHGMAGCHKDEQDLDPCEGKCDRSESCYLSKGEVVCESRPGRCWTWGSQHYRTFDGFNYDVDGTCTYLLLGSKGDSSGAPPFSVSKKTTCQEASPMQLVTIQVYGFIIKLADEDSVHVNGEVNYIPITLLRGKIDISNKDGKALLKTDFGLHVLFDWNTTIFITLNPQYKGIVYGLCGNFNDDPQDDYTANVPGSPPVNSTLVELAQVYRLFDGNHKCCTGCKQKLDIATFLEDMADVEVSSESHCADLLYPTGQYAWCHSLVNPDPFHGSCVGLVPKVGAKAAVDQTTSSYSLVCKELNEDFLVGVPVSVRCPPNSHYKTCGSACPITCEHGERFCIQACVKGCFCNPGFIASPEGCVPPKQCGCTDSRGKYHSLNSAFWVPDDCGQLCTCRPGGMHCSPSQCPKGMSCNQLTHKRVCQPDKPLNCSVVTGLHFTSFDGHRFDFRDSCAYTLVQTKATLNGPEPFSITISNASCHNKFSHCLTLTLSVYGLEIVVGKEDPGKVLVDGLQKLLPYSHQTGHFNAYRTPSSVIVHLDMGLQVVVYKTGTVVVVLPSNYASYVHGLCGNANSNPYDDEIMPDDEEAQNMLEFAHSWRLGGPMACRSSCTSRVKNCPVDARKIFEGSDFCGVLVNELGPFAECALVLNPKPYFLNCVEDACSYGGHNLALCSSITSYAAACQAAQLPVRQWRSDTFCGMTCPMNSHYELCGPRCPVVCAGLSSLTSCTGVCEEGCQCDPGYILSDGHCVLVADCGCLNEGQYHPAGYFYDGKSCQICHCYERKLSCTPSPCRPRNGLTSLADLFHQQPRQYGVCEVFAGVGYVTFDGLVIPHYGNCTYLVSDRSPKALYGHTVLLSFEKTISDSGFVLRKLVFIFNSVKMTIDPETPWIIQVNGEDQSVPYNNGLLQAYEDGDRLTITTVAGVKLELSSSKYLRLSIPQNDDTASGLCGNFNGDKSDDMELRTGNLAQSVAEFLHSWSVGQSCNEISQEDYGPCKLSSNATLVCDVLLTPSIEFSHCLSRGVEAHVYRDVCLKAICGGSAYMEAVCLALEAYTAACQAKGITVGSWRENTPCSYKCPDRSSPSQCVDSASNSCPALLQPGSSASGCSGGCQCLNGNVFDGGKCVPVSQCGCMVHGRYVKVEEQLYTDNCTQRCWCHPLGGALCENAACSPGQICALRNGSWGCQVKQEVCQLKDSLQVSTFNGQQLSLAPKTPYRLMGLCDEAGQNWFSLISYYGPCDGGSTRLVTVFQILLLGFSVTIQDGIVKVNGHVVPLPHSLPLGVSLSYDMTQDKSEVAVILKRDFGLEAELEMEIGVTMVTLKASPWYTGKLCGVCGNLNDPHSHKSLKTWVLSDFRGCFTRAIGHLRNNIL